LPLLSTAHSLIASPNKSAYVMAKHGIVGLTKTVALEVATQGITVNNICPGYVWTSLVENQIPDTMKARGLTRDQVINDVLLANQPQPVPWHQARERAHNLRSLHKRVSWLAPMCAFQFRYSGV
jgi:NAD(P)-dependent dehydrogenase (short-subunit alcohol dehydrogenase family)